MRVCLETSAIRSPMTGIGYYALSLAKNLLNEAPALEYYCFDGAGVQPMTEAGLDRRAGAVARVDGLANRAMHFVGQSSLVRHAYRWFKGHRFEQTATTFDLFHAINFVAPRETNGPVLPLIHDISFERLPQTHPSERVTFLRKRLARLEQYAFVNTPSHFTAREVADFYAYPLERIVVTHPGVDERLRGEPTAAAQAEVAALGLADRSFFLMVGTIEPRKNHKVVVEAYAGMPAEVRRRFPLVIAGAVGWGSLEVAGQEDLVREGSVRFIGYASTDLVHALYTRASALLFPSLYEGFGMPVAEAMACGLPLIVSDIAVMHEVAGDCGTFVDPNNPQAWRDTLLTAMETAVTGDARTALIDRSRRFNWPDTARKTADLYHKYQ